MQFINPHHPNDDADDCNNDDLDQNSDAFNSARPLLINKPSSDGAEKESQKVNEGKRVEVKASVGEEVEEDKQGKETNEENEALGTEPERKDGLIGSDEVKERGMDFVELASGLEDYR